MKITKNMKIKLIKKYMNIKYSVHVEKYVLDMKNKQFEMFDEFGDTVLLANNVQSVYFDAIVFFSENSFNMI